MQTHHDHQSHPIQRSMCDHKHKPLLGRGMIAGVVLMMLIQVFNGMSIAGPSPSVSGDVLSGLEMRPENLTCLAPRRPIGERPTTVEAEVVSVFHNFQFEGPIDMAQPPHDASRWLLATRRGLIWTFANDENVETRTVALNLQSRMRFTRNNQSQQWGITSLAFHPQFPDQPYLYIAYNARKDRESLVESVVSRFETADGGLTFDTASETVVLTLVQDIINPLRQAVSRFHHLGQIAFGNDGYLYIGFGDPNGSTAQDLNNWHGSILRIDVDAGEPYAIPPDNPFVGIAGVKEEIYAYGLRNPWRFSFDRQAGQLWAGDVGWDSWEEVDVVVPGANYGWKILEGNHCVEPGCDPTGLTPPVVEYSHDIGAAVIGGFVYQGQAMPELVGSYVFGDASAREIWQLRLDEQGVIQRQAVAQLSSATPHFFAQDLAGELYFMAARSEPQSVFKLVPKTPAPNAAPVLAQRLSLSGCFNPDHPQEPVAGVIPYQINSPLWSDGATKERWMAIPDGTQVVAQPDGDFDFPIGTVLAKTFSIESSPVETRLLIRHHDGGWAGYSYAWLDDGTDAVLLESGKRKELFNGQQWTYPGRRQCTVCHTQVAGFALGPELAQLNGEFTYSATGRTANQLVTLQHIGVLHDPQDRSPERLPVLVGAGDPNWPIEVRARSYLHANCSGCHRPEGPTQAQMNLRFFVNTEAMNVCHEAPLLSNLGIQDAALIVPGDPERSVLYQRMNRRGQHQMPPIGTVLIDTVAVADIAQWILSENVCPERTTGQARIK